MNNILVNKEEKLDREEYEFLHDDTIFFNVEDIRRNVSFIVKDSVRVVINILAKKVDLTFNIRLSKNSCLTINSLVLGGCINSYVVLGEDSAEFNYNYSVISNRNSHNIVEVRHLANNTVSHLKNHGFSIDKADIIFDVNAYINKIASKCISNQDNKIIEKENSLSQINPNLYIDNYDVEASHSAYVGEFKENELFYLMSRGISRDDAEFLLLKAFLLGTLSGDILERFTYQIIKYIDKEV